MTLPPQFNKIDSDNTLKKHNDILAITNGHVCLKYQNNNAFFLPKLRFNETLNRPEWVWSYKAKKNKGKVIFYKIKEKPQSLFGVAFKNEELFEEFKTRELKNRRRLDLILMGASEIKAHGRVLIPQPYRIILNPKCANTDQLAFIGHGNNFEIYRITQEMQNVADKALYN